MSCKSYDDANTVLDDEAELQWPRLRTVPLQLHVTLYPLVYKQILHNGTTGTIITVIPISRSVQLDSVLQLGLCDSNVPLIQSIW